MLNQMALTYLAEIMFYAQVALVRQAYRTRRNAMLASLERFMLAGFKWSKPEGGMFVWIEGPKGLDARKLHDCAVMHDRWHSCRAGHFSPMDQVLRRCALVSCWLNLQ